MIQLLASTVGTSVNIDGINGAWSVPVYYAPAGTPLQQVCDTNDYRPCEMVPVPANMHPSPDADAKSVIVDLATNRAWSFYGMVKGNGSNGDWTSLDGAFGWGYISSQGDGIHNYGGGMWGGRVTGWNYYAGLIHPEEIQAGVINHAIAFFIPSQDAKSGTYVWPAAGTDGTSSSGSAIPLGSRIQLDPSINVNSLPLSAGGKAIARALQVYGGWIADTGVAAAVDAEEFVTSNGLGIDASEWNGLLTYRDLYGLPVSSFRVLQVNQSDFYVEGSDPPPTNTPTHAPTNTSTHAPTHTPSPTNTPTHAPTHTPTPVPTSGLPMSAPTIYDSMDSGAPNWKGSGTWTLTKAAAYGGSGLGWLATGGTATNVLRWNYQIDLRNVPNAYLWVQSILSSGNTGYVQASLDGSSWHNVGTISPSSSWKVPSINLSAYVGSIIQLRFRWVPNSSSDLWKLDDVTVGVLQTATATPSRTPTRTPIPTQANQVNVALPMSAPTIYDGMDSGAPNWQGNGTWTLTKAAAYGGSGLGWLATGGTATNLLYWNYRIDLRRAPNAYLWVQSILSSGNTGYVQASTDGGSSWHNVSTIGPSSSWNVPSINLSAYVGDIIQLRFRWVPNSSSDLWKLDDVTIGVLQTAQANVAQANLLQANVQPMNQAAIIATPTQAVATPAPTVLAQTIPSGYVAVESDASAVSANSAWQVTTQPSGASGTSYLINSDPSATLSLPFRGTAVGVAFVLGPSFGQFALEIDGATQRVVNTNAPDYQFGQVVIDGLSAGAHTVRVIPSGGVVGIDAFLVQANIPQTTAAPTQATQPAPTPTNVPTQAAVTNLPTALPFPTLNIPLDLPDATAAAPTAESTEAPTVSVSVDATPAGTQLPTALPFPTLDIPIDLPSVTVPAPTAQSPVPTSVSALPISAPTVYDSMDDGAHDWQATGNWQLIAQGAYGGAGLGWRAQGGTTNLLRWNRLIDLRSVPNAYLWVQSKLSAGSTASVQVSLDGSTWSSVGTINPSSNWYVPSIDLSAYVGQVIQIQFVWNSPNASDVWHLDDVTVGVLNSATPAPTSASDSATPSAPTATPVPPTQAPTQKPTHVPTATSTSVPTDVPTQAPSPTQAATHGRRHTPVPTETPSS